MRRSSYLQMLRALATTDFREALLALAAPTLVVVGEHDRITPPSVAEGVASRIRGAERAVIAGSGHLPNREQAAVFDQIVGAFLRRHAARATPL